MAVSGGHPSIPPVGHAGGSSKPSGIEAEAAQVVGNLPLLREVLRRACLVETATVASALADAMRRLDAIERGGYVERFGSRVMPRTGFNSSFDGNAYCHHSGVDADLPIARAENDNT